jgi:hypothetical protein
MNFLKRLSFNPFLNIIPKRSAFTDRFSSRTTSRAATATAAATDFHQSENHVVRFNHIHNSLLANTAETG